MLLAGGTGALARAAAAPTESAGAAVARVAPQVPPAQQPAPTAAGDTAFARGFAQATAAPVDSSSIRTFSLPEQLPDSAAALPRASGGDRRARAARRDSLRVAALAAPQPWSDQPRFVMLRSLVIPGWGQFHNRAYLKAGLVAAAESWMIVGLVSDKGDLDALQRAALEAQTGGNPAQAEAAVNAYNDRLDRHTRRQWLLAGVVVYSLLDAYVDAHFKNFDIEFRNDPAPPGTLAPGTQRLDLRWTF